MTTPMKSVKTSARHRAFHFEFAELMKSRFADVPSEELLALAAYVTGQLVALQDQRTMAPERAMAIVATNIEAGNRDAILSLVVNTQGTA